MRCKKFSVDRAFKLYEYHFIFRKSHPEWNDTSDKAFDRTRQLIKSGYIYPVGRGADGQLIIMLNHGRFDTEKFCVEDLGPLIMNGISFLLGDEKNQVCGFEVILNYNGVTMKYVSGFTVKQHLDLIDLGLNAMPGRYKKFYLVNLPSFGHHFVTIAKMAMSEKMKNRLQLVKNIEELKNYIDVKNLPKQYGGEASEAKITEKFIERFDKSIDSLKAQSMFELDLEKTAAANEAAAIVGSFRKLEID